MSLIAKILAEVKGRETRCGCGVVTIGLPPMNRFKIACIGDPDLQGIYFNCICNSTHFIPLKIDLSELAS